MRYHFAEHRGEPVRVVRGVQQGGLGVRPGLRRRAAVGGN
jgi:hypothetical protein